MLWSQTALGSWTISWTKPQPADVILYSYLWCHEAARGEESGRKDRPCLVLAATVAQVGLKVITVPITSKNYDPTQSVTLPPRVAQHLGLATGSRIVCNDLNRFTWVGPDVRATKDGTPFFGQVPARLFEEVRARVLSNAVRATERTS